MLYIIKINLKYLTILSILVSLSLVKAQDKVKNSTVTPGAYQEKPGLLSNDSAMIVRSESTKSLERFKPDPRDSIVTHILRTKRSEDINLPYESNIWHMFCDIDDNGRSISIDYFPAHCKYLWQYRFVNEDYYKAYKTYQVEAFFFGQYFERLRRFELDPHSFDYDE